MLLCCRECVIASFGQGLRASFRANARMCFEGPGVTLLRFMLRAADVDLFRCCVRFGEDGLLTEEHLFSTTTFVFANAFFSSFFFLFFIYLFTYFIFFLFYFNLFWFVFSSFQFVPVLDLLSSAIPRCEACSRCQAVYMSLCSMFLNILPDLMAGYPDYRR